MEEKELNMLKEFNFNPLAPKQLSDTIKLLVTVAKSEPDAEKSKLQLSEIYSYLTNSEDIVTSLLNSIRTSKTYTMKISVASDKREALLVFSPSTQFRMKWESSETDFYLYKDPSTLKPYFGGYLEQLNWTLTLACENPNLYITNVKFYGINDN